MPFKPDAKTSRFTPDATSSTEAPSQAMAFGKSAFESLGGAGGGLAGATAGMSGGAALGAMTGPFAPVAVPALGLTGAVVGGLAGGYGGEKLQETVGEYVPESVKQFTGFTPAQREKETKAYPTTSTIGKYAPDIAVGGKALYDLGKLGYASAKDLAGSLLGKKTAAQQGKLVTEAEQAGQAGARTLSAEQEAARKSAEAEQKAMQGKSAAAMTKAEQAAKAEGKATAVGGRTLKELAGVRTLSGESAANVFKPVPQTAADVGNYIREQVNNFVKSVKFQRNKAAEQSFSNAKNEAALKQSRGQFVDTTPLSSTIDTLIQKGGPSDYVRSLTTLKNDLAVTKDFEGLEVIRRKLGDIGFGLPESGYDAIGQGFAKEMYRDLSQQMKSYSKDFEKYLEDYARLSKNLEAVGTKVGKGITQTQDAGGAYYAKTAEQVSKDIFSSPEKFTQFVDAVGGNRQIADAAARRYFAGLAEKAKTPKAVEDLLGDNRALLNEIPAIRQEITSRYLAPLLQAEKRAGAAKEIGAAETGIVKDLSNQIKEVDKSLAKRLGNIEQGKTLFSDSVKTLSSAKPGKAIETFDNTVLPRIREAEVTSGVKILDESQIAILRQQVLQLDKIADQASKQVLAAQISAGLVGLGAAFGVGKKTVEVMSGQ